MLNLKINPRRNALGHYTDEIEDPNPYDRATLFLLRDWCRGAGMIPFNWPSRGVKTVKLRPDCFKEPIVCKDVEVKSVYYTIAELRCDIGRREV